MKKLFINLLIIVHCLSGNGQFAENRNNPVYIVHQQDDNADGGLPAICTNLLDSSIQYNYQDGKQKPYTLTVYQYNRNCQVFTEKNFFWKEKKKEWKQESDTRYVYDADGKLVSKIGGFSGLINYKLEYFYNTQGLLDSLDMSSIAVNYITTKFYLKYYYNNDGTIKATKGNMGIEAKKELDQQMIINYTYNNKKQMIYAESYLLPGDVIKENKLTAKTSFEYDNKDSVKYSKQINVDDNSITETFYEYSYPEDKTTVTTTYIASDQFPVKKPFYRTTQKFDENKNILSTLNELWDEKKKVWEMGGIVINVYRK